RFVLYDESVYIPPDIRDLASFRRWVHSDEFPETARICFLNGEVWVDMSGEQVFSHNQVKGEFTAVLTVLVKTARLGRFLPDGVQLTSVSATFSCRPDGTFVSQESLKRKRVRLV